MQKAFEEFIDESLFFIREKKLLIAVSGGLDSTVLSWLCHELNLNFSLAHCNFNLRGEHSNKDEAFVMELGETLDVEVFVQNFDTMDYAEGNGTSIQMAARELRYNWLKELAQQLNYDYIVTAHHADDNLETFLINFLRGTGLNGLTGIPLVNDNIVRPLLPFTREDILDFAKSHNIAWREDSSNSTRKYLRNKLRHDVIPILKEINPQLLDCFHDTLSNLKDTADIVEESLNAVAKRAIVSIDEGGVTYKISEFKKVNNPKGYLFEMFKNFGFSEWNDVLSLLNAETGKFVASDTHKLLKHREFLILTELKSSKPAKQAQTIDISKGKISTPVGSIIIEEASAQADNSAKVIYVDAEQFKGPLVLRVWEKDDIFYPLGLNGKKKLSKYLKDEKLMPLEKENTLVLTSNNKIVWVVGRRADDRFKVMDSTKSILKISIV